MVPDFVLHDPAALLSLLLLDLGMAERVAWVVLGREDVDDLAVVALA